ncbi:1-aminocyclopropane-1-carboxylate synthase, partial [Trifolium pratense]
RMETNDAVKTDAKKDEKKDDKSDEKKHETKDEKNDEIKDVGRGADDKDDENSTCEEEEFDANKMDDAVRTACNVGLSPTQQTILQFPQYFDAGKGSNERELYTGTILLVEWFQRVVH